MSRVNIVIEVRGGVVQNVYTDSKQNEVAVIVNDWDDAAEDEEVRKRSEDFENAWEAQGFRVVY